MEAASAYLPFLGKGVLVTVELTVLGLAMALVIALVVGIARGSRVAPIRWLSGAFVEVFRGTSALVQLFWVFYAMPLLTGYQLAPLAAGVIVLGLNQGSYAAEVVRNAIQEVPRAQQEAAAALNMTRWQTLRHVLLPQAFARMLPSLGNVAVDTLKNTALVSLVTISDLTFRAQQVRTSIGHTALLFGVLLVVYFVLSQLLTFGRHRLERRLPAGLVYRGTAR